MRERFLGLIALSGGLIASASSLVLVAVVVTRIIREILHAPAPSSGCGLPALAALIVFPMALAVMAAAVAWSTVTVVECTWFRTHPSYLPVATMTWNLAAGALAFALAMPSGRK